MPTQHKLKYPMLLVGAAITVIALLLFVTSLFKMVPFPPVLPMEFVIIIFGILGIHFGISSGRRLAYTVHDRDIILERLQGHGRASSKISKIMQVPILLTAFTIIAWTLFVIGFSLSKSVVVDTVLIGYVRWVLIFSMIMLIVGSYFFYKARGLGKHHMLTFKGKIILEHSTSMMGEAMQRMDRAEERGRDMANHTEERGREIYHQAEDAGRGIVNRIEDEEKELVDRIRKKF
ncbi:MAG: hypothetical protein KAS16_02930 [Thermoplasmata archaeon]|nr:hypothetical protein [Thermoplasmata archaeon]